MSGRLSHRWWAFPALLAAAVIVPRASNAQWSKLPNGELSFHGTYTSALSFGCGRFGDPMLGATCVPLAGGNGITIWNNGASLTLSVAGASGAFDATNVARRIVLGTIQETVGGTGPFLFPAAGHPQNSLIFLGISLAMTSPLTSQDMIRQGYLVRKPQTAIAPNCCGGFGTYMGMPTTQPPPGFRFGGIIVDRISRPMLLAQDNTIIIEASYGLIPEPSTVVLLGSGLVGLAGVVARRRRRAA